MISVGLGDVIENHTVHQTPKYKLQPGGWAEAHQADNKSVTTKL